jgi:hypothetical protein
VSAAETSAQTKDRHSKKRETLIALLYSMEWAVKEMMQVNTIFLVSILRH